jgi:hypothetical protein
VLDEHLLVILFGSGLPCQKIIFETDEGDIALKTASQIVVAVVNLFDKGVKKISVQR